MRTKPGISRAAGPSSCAMRSGVAGSTCPTGSASAYDGKRLGARGSCDCAQDDTWLAQGDSSAVLCAPSPASRGQLARHPARSWPVILREAKRSRRIHLSQGKRFDIRGSCDCAQDDTWLAQGDSSAVLCAPSPASRAQLARHPARSWPVILPEANRSRRIHLSQGKRLDIRGSCDCAQDDTWLAQGDSAAVLCAPSAAFRAQLARHPARSWPVILREAKRSRRIHLSQGKRLDIRGSCDCAQDDTWAARCDSLAVMLTPLARDRPKTKKPRRSGALQRDLAA